MRTERVGVTKLDRIPTGSKSLLTNTPITHSFTYSYSIPKLPKAEWVDFNVKLCVVQEEKNTKEKVFDCDFIYTERIYNSKNKPPRDLLANITELGIRLCYSTLFELLGFDTIEEFSTALLPSYPFELSLLQAEDAARHLFVDYGE